MYLSYCFVRMLLLLSPAINHGSFLSRSLRQDLIVTKYETKDRPLKASPDSPQLHDTVELLETNGRSGGKQDSSV